MRDTSDSLEIKILLMSRREAKKRNGDMIEDRVFAGIATAWRAGAGAANDFAPPASSPFANGRVFLR
jgi:hypothetical protein